MPRVAPEQRGAPPLMRRARRRLTLFTRCRAAVYARAIIDEIRALRVMLTI